MKSRLTLMLILILLSVLLSPAQNFCMDLSGFSGAVILNLNVCNDDTEQDSFYFLPESEFTVPLHINRPEDFITLATIFYHYIEDSLLERPPSYGFPAEG